MFLKPARHINRTLYRTYLAGVRFWGIIAFCLLLTQSLSVAAFTQLTDETIKLSKGELDLWYLEDANNHYDFDQVLSGELNKHFNEPDIECIKLGDSNTISYYPDIKIDIRTTTTSEKKNKIKTQFDGKRIF